jgi:hypothetical protein
MRRKLVPTIMLLAGSAFGFLSAEYLMETKNVAVPVADSKWQEVQQPGSDFQSTYLTGHFLGRGEIPPPKGARFFVRTVDDEGNVLRGDCLVAMEGRLPETRWWFVSAARGNTRKTLDAGQAVREANGETNVSFFESPVPGNWIIPPSSTYELQLVLLGVEGAADEKLDLPKLKRLRC